MVHKMAICAKSPFFQAACSREWKEGQDRLIRLPEFEPDCFLVYIHRIYTSVLDMTLLPEPSGTRFAPAYVNLAKVWMLANYLQDDEMCNGVTDRLLTKLDGHPKHFIVMETLEFVGTHTSPESGIRRLFKDVMVARAREGRVQELSVKGLPLEIMAEMAKKFARGERREGGGPSMANRCKYHVHVGGKESCG